ncbi:MAG: JAB domain-containing protein [Bacteroidia bacterium]
MESKNEISEIEVRYKNKVKPSERIKINGSKDIYEAAKTVFNADTIEYTEEFIVFYLNRANKILGWVKISSGGINGTVADSRVIFGIALKAAASSLILAHNHPSGNLTPSNEDKELTRKLIDAGKLLEIKVLDHIIVTSESYYSFSDEGTVNF